MHIEKLKEYLEENELQYAFDYIMENQSEIVDELNRCILKPVVNVGDTVYFTDFFKKNVHWAEVEKLTYEENDLGIYTGIWGEYGAFSVFFDDVGKEIFLTKEECEEYIKNLNS